MSADLAVLTLDETTRLRRAEEVIGRGLKTFKEVGQELAGIRDARLYRGTHATFEAYCAERWGLSYRHVNRLIESAQIVEALGPMGPTPASERQARELSGLPTDTAAEIMRKAHDDTGGKITAGAIREARQAVAPKPLAPSVATETARQLAASDADYARQAADMERELREERAVAPSPAVTDWVQSSQAVQDASYVHQFMRVFARTDDFLGFDPERLAHLLDVGECESVDMFAASVTRFADTLRRSRSGLRVINGGN